MPFELTAATEFVMAQQRDQDVAKDAIHNKLSNAVLDNYTRFIDGMKFVDVVDDNLFDAEVTVGNILRQLRDAKSSFVEKALVVVHRRRRRERLTAVYTRLNWLRVRPPPTTTHSLTLLLLTHAAVPAAARGPVTSGPRSRARRRWCSRRRRWSRCWTRTNTASASG